MFPSPSPPRLQNTYNPLRSFKPPIAIEKKMPPENPSMTFDEVSMETSKGFIKALQVRMLLSSSLICFSRSVLGDLSDFGWCWNGVWYALFILLLDLSIEFPPVSLYSSDFRTFPTQICKKNLCNSIILCFDHFGFTGLVNFSVCFICFERFIRVVLSSLVIDLFKYLFLFFLLICFFGWLGSLVMLRWL